MLYIVIKSKLIKAYRWVQNKYHGNISFSEEKVLKLCPFLGIIPVQTSFAKRMDWS